MTDLQEKKEEFLQKAMELVMVSMKCESSPKDVQASSLIAIDRLMEAMFELGRENPDG